MSEINIEVLPEENEPENVADNIVDLAVVTGENSAHIEMTREEIEEIETQINEVESWQKSMMEQSAAMQSQLMTLSEMMTQVTIQIMELATLAQPSPEKSAGDIQENANVINALPENPAAELPPEISQEPEPEKHNQVRRWI